MIAKGVFASVMLLSMSTMALADHSSGKILAYDRKAKLIVMKDKTVWSLDGTESVPPDLKAGDSIDVEFESAGEDGITKIEKLTLAPN
jgi:hypothetical protein